MLKLFEYAVILNHKRTKKQEEDGAPVKGELLVPITSVLARDDKEVQIIAARQIPEAHVDKLDQIQIAIRPF